MEPLVTTSQTASYCYNACADEYSSGSQEAEAEASYVAGFPVPLPLPPGPPVRLD